MGRPPSVRAPITRWDPSGTVDLEDEVAAEEPLQLALDGEPLSVVMRTPGHDTELALGLLYAERVIRHRDDVADVAVSAEEGGDLLEPNLVDVRLEARPGRLVKRSFLSSSACGVCGATTLESLALEFPLIESRLTVPAASLPRLVDALRATQRVFERTGGLHAAGFFTADGEAVVVREDVGRHNAVDKSVGRLLLDGQIPASDFVLAVSGRLGYEVVQKAVAAGVPILVGVGAPSSLAVATAQRFGVTLAGFLRGERFNVYSSPERLELR